MVDFLSGFFVNPAFWAIAAGLISVPIIIHLINRLRFRRVRWAAMEFLLKAQKKNRRRLIIEQLLLLALRCLLVGLFGFLVMRFVGVNFADMGVKQSIHIVLLDDSLSMQDRWKKGEDYTNCFEVARDDMLIGKLGEHLSRSKTADQIIVLPLSQAVGETLFAVSGAITSEDAPDSTFGSKGGRMAIVTISQPLEKGQRYGVQATFEGFKGHVRLVAPSGKLLVHDDDSGGMTVAGVEHETRESGEYKVVVASHEGKLGRFHIEVTSSGAPKTYVPSSDFKKFKEEMSKLTCTKLHLSLAAGLRRARKLAERNPNAMITLHVFSDFRKKDWGEEGGALHKELLEFSKTHKAQVRLVDCMLDPARSGTQGAPPAHDNIGVVDLRPRNRMVGRNMPATFTLSLVNYGAQEREVDVVIYEQSTGRECVEVDFVPRPLTLPPRRISQFTFELRFNPDIDDNESFFAGISAHIKGLEKEGLQADNIGYGVVEVRKQVPVLIVDGEGKAGYENVAKGRDSFFLEQAFRSVPGTDESGESLRPYRVDLPFRMGVKGEPASVLESGDLRKYPAIILCNVPRLNRTQLANLKKFVQDGGGLGIFLGPLVDTEFYRKEFYEDGKGLFPVKLAKTYFPAEGKEPLDPPYIPEVPMMIVRDEDSRIKPFPIFGAIFTHPKQREFLEYIPIKRYFKVEEYNPRDALNFLLDGQGGDVDIGLKRGWRDDKTGNKGQPRVLELATLGNDEETSTYQKKVKKIIDDIKDQLEKKEFARYRGTPPSKTGRGTGFDRYLGTLRVLVDPTLSQQKPFFLARELDRMLQDRGDTKEAPNLEDFWSNPDPEVQRIKADVKKLLEKVRYDDGAPYVLASSYGFGKVVTVLGTAGEAWNRWPGGIGATALYQPFIWEMQNYLSAQGADVNLMLGQRLDVSVNTAAFPKRSVQMLRAFKQEIKEKKEVRVYDDGQIVDASDDKPLEAKLTFSYPTTKEPGVYVTELYDYELKLEERSSEAKKGEPIGPGKKIEDPEKKKSGDPEDKTPKEPERKPGPDEKKKAAGKLKPLWASASVFNVDTVHEGDLERVTFDFIKVNVLDKADKRIMFTGTDVTSAEMVPTRKDLSEMPLLFLLFLAILVAEQALAVHLSFHLKGKENAGRAGVRGRAA